MPGPLRETGPVALLVRIVAIFGCLAWPGSEHAFGAQEPSSRLPGATRSSAGESPPVEPAAVKPTSPGSTVTPSPDAANPGTPSATATAGQPKPPGPAAPKPGTTLPKLAELRAETTKRIEAIDAAAAVAASDAAAKTGATGLSGAKPAVEVKALRDLLQARLDWMAEYEKAEKAYRDATGAQPEKDKATAKAELEKLTALLVQAGQTPAVLLPQAFRGPTNEVNDSVRTEMKDAIEATENELKDWTAKLDAAKGDSAKSDEVRAAMRAERDKIFQKIAALKVRAAEGSPAAAKASKAATPDSLRLDQERRLNLEWETQVETLRLKAQEARIALEAKLTAVDELQVQVNDAHVRLAKKVLDQMQLRLRAASDLQQRDLKRAAASEEKRAAKAEDPLERYRARRTAELLEMEAQTVKFEQSLAANPSPSPEEQKALTIHAQEDFDKLKMLLKDGEVSRLDAMRLNNDFRRIGPERERVARNEMTTIEARVQFYSNALTEAELALLEDAHQDQFEHDALLERLPAARRPTAELVFDEIERKHLAILIRRKEALKKLAYRATDALREVTARLAVLDEEYGFIRTSIFWVRDQDPIGPETVGQGGREVARLGKAVYRLAGEAIDQRNWSRASAEFIAAASGLVLLPLGLFRIRRKLGHRIAIDLPDLASVPDPPDPVPAPGSTPGQPHRPEPD